MNLTWASGRLLYGTHPSLDLGYQVGPYGLAKCWSAKIQPRSNPLWHNTINGSSKSRWHKGWTYMTISFGVPTFSPWQWKETELDKNKSELTSPACLDTPMWVHYVLLSGYPVKLSTYLTCTCHNYIRIYVLQNQISFIF